MSARVDIAMGFDVKYAPHAGACIASVVQTAPGASFRFILVHASVSTELQAKVEACAPGATFVWVEAREEDLPLFAERGHFNRSILFRLGLPKFAPADSHRLLYLDSDTIVLRDVRGVYNADLGGAALGAVRDRYTKPDEFVAKWQLSSDKSRYFNSGVLVIDLDRARADGGFEKALEFVVRHDAALMFADQDALNYVFWDRWTELNAAWNVQRFVSAKDYAALAPERRWDGDAPAIVHFVGWEKPWAPDKWHPWAWAYWEASERTPFARDVARENGMDVFQMLKVRLRWWFRKPPTMKAA